MKRGLFELPLTQADQDLEKVASLCSSVNDARD